MKGYSKKTKKEIRRLSELAHERELEKALSDLQLKFKQWENNKLDSFELDHEIHQFHNKTSRDIFNRYNERTMADFFVALAITRNVIDKEEVDPEAYQELELLIERIKDSDNF
jgi:hypothetical protein